MNEQLRAWDVLLQLLFADDSDATNEQLRTSLAARGFPWERFVTLANVHIVPATTWRAIVDRGLEATAPADISTYLSSFHKLNRARNDSIEQQLVRCIDLFASRDIASMPLKGCAYRLMDRAGFSDRFLTDIDILVPGKLAARAWDVMIGNGYVPTEKAHLRPAGHHHLLPLQHPEEPAVIEIHTDAVHRKAAAALPVESLWQNAVETGHGCMLPNLTDAGQIAFIHSEVIDRCQAQLHVPLRTFHDLHRLMMLDTIDWGANRNRARRIGAEPRLNLFLDVFDRVRKAPSPTLAGSTWRGSIQYTSARALLRWPKLTALTTLLNKLSETELRESYGFSGGFLTLCSYRIRRILLMLRNGMSRMIGRSPHTA